MGTLLGVGVLIIIVSMVHESWNNKKIEKIYPDWSFQKKKLPINGDIIILLWVFFLLGMFLSEQIKINI